MKKLGIVILIVIVLAVVGRLTSPDEAGTGRVGEMTAAERHYVELLDEAIYNVGYVAGMAYSHPVWPETRAFVGPDGQYTRALLVVRRPGLSDEATATMNLDRYEEGRDAGSVQAFSESDAAARTQRVIDIVEREMIPAMRAAFE